MMDKKNKEIKGRSKTIWTISEVAGRKVVKKPLVEDIHHLHLLNSGESTWIELPDDLETILLKAMEGE